jgi:hypothetical protein
MPGQQVDEWDAVRTAIFRYWKRATDLVISWREILQLDK